MKKITYASFLLAMLLTQTALSQPQSSIIPLGGGDLLEQPDRVEISLSEIPLAAPYDITCKLTSDDQSHSILDTFGVYYRSNHQRGYQLDGGNVRTNLEEITISPDAPHTLTLLRVENTMFAVPLIFENLDDHNEHKDILTISDCFATPSLN